MFRMKFEIEYTSQLISKYLLQDISESELTDLEEWLEDPYNQLQFKSILDSENLNETLLAYEKINAQKAWRSVDRKLFFSSRIKGVLAYAAVILIPIGLSILALISNQDLNEYSKSDLYSDVILGEDNVTLITNEGLSVNLNEFNDAVVFKHVDVSVDSNSISYVSTSVNLSEKLNFNTLNIPRGMQYQLVLEDGTKVWLNSKTRFKYPVSFLKNERTVYLYEGEAFFDVAKDNDKPFVVQFEDAKIKVLGTQFNIKSYKDDHSSLVTLMEGNVRLESDKGQLKMSPNQQVEITKANSYYNLSNVNAYDFCAWKDRILFYKNMSLDEIMNDISRQYDIKVFYQNQGCKNEVFSIRVKKTDSVKDILRYIEKSSDIKFDVKDDAVVVISK